MNGTVSVVICTHNPNRAVFDRCLSHLRRQSPDISGSELVIVDNASSPPLSVGDLGLASFPYPARLVREEKPGLTHARRRGAKEARGDFVLYVDDDNLLAPDYLLQTARFFEAHPNAGAVGGRTHAVADVDLPPWFPAVATQLAIRDWSDASLKLPPDHHEALFGAGLAARRQALQQAFEHPMVLTDRKGRKLSSGGDIEICYRIRLRGWELWYEPFLHLGHFLPSQRLQLSYVERLSYHFGICSPYLEFYKWPEIPQRRLFYLRRAIFHWREAHKLLAQIDLSNRTIESIKDQLAIQMIRGTAKGYAQAAFGPPLWEIAAKFTSITSAKTHGNAGKPQFTP